MCILAALYSVTSDSATPWAIARQAPLSMGIPRQEHWSGLLFPPPGYLPNPGIERASPESPAWADRFSATSPCGKPMCILG